MASKKNTKKATADKPAEKSAKSTKTTVVTRTVASSSKSKGLKFKKLDTKLPDNLINIIIAETIGTFILTLVALFAAASSTLPLYVGLTLVVLVMIIGNISGSHVNPAVTFGLWSARKLKTILVPFYWVAQLLGAVAAVVLIGALSNGAFAVHFDNFTEFSAGIFTLELIGTAVFLFGLTAVVSRADIKPSGKALGIGLSLLIGVLVTSTLMPHIQRAAFTKMQSEQTATSEDQLTNADGATRTYPREIYVSGATLNPAVAIAATESTDSQLQGSAAAEGDRSISRFGLETILATLIGAAIGANLFLLVGFRNKTEN